jgi:hypothetical protein
MTMVGVYAIGFVVLFAAGSYAWDAWIQILAFAALTAAGRFCAPEFFVVKRRDGYIRH